MSAVSRVTGALCLTAALLLAGGCMSLEHIFDSEQKLAMYGGTQASFDYLEAEDASFFGKFIRILDLPLTMVVDTVLLPVSAPVSLSRGSE